MTARVEHRQHDEAAVPRAGRVREVHLHDVRGHRAVAEHRAFRGSRRTARVHLIERIGHADLDARRRRRSLRQPAVQRNPAAAVLPALFRPLLLGERNGSALDLVAQLVGTHDRAYPDIAWTTPPERSMIERCVSW